MNNSVILDIFGFQRRYISMLVDDIAEEQMTAQLGGVVNHPAWQLGHMACTLDRFGRTLGKPQGVDAAWEKQFSPGSVPVADRSAYPSKAELIRVLDERRAVVAEAFGACSADDLGKPLANAKNAAIFPTTGHFLVFGLLTHEATHLGQLAVWRKAAGMVPALSKIGR